LESLEIKAQKKRTTQLEPHTIDQNKESLDDLCQIGNSDSGTWPDPLGIAQSGSISL